jgi:hypothetical protein
MGLANAMIKEYTTSYNQLKTSLEILKRCLGNDHVEVADCFANLGDVCMKLLTEEKNVSKLAEAKQNYTEANRIIAKSFGAGHTKCNQFASLLFIIDNYDSLSN